MAAAGTCPGVRVAFRAASAASCVGSFRRQPGCGVPPGWAGAGAALPFHSPVSSPPPVVPDPFARRRAPRLGRGPSGVLVGGRLAGRRPFPFHLKAPAGAGGVAVAAVLIGRLRPSVSLPTGRAAAGQRPASALVDRVAQVDALELDGVSVVGLPVRRAPPHLGMLSPAVGGALRQHAVGFAQCLGKACRPVVSP